MIGPTKADAPATSCHDAVKFAVLQLQRVPDRDRVAEDIQLAACDGEYRVEGHDEQQREPDDARRGERGPEQTVRLHAEPPSTPAVDRYVAWSWVICRW